MYDDKQLFIQIASVAFIYQAAAIGKPDLL
jgi:hypothetical protein